MRRGHATSSLAIAALLAAPLGACSLLTSWDGLTGEGDASLSGLRDAALDGTSDAGKSSDGASSDGGSSTGDGATSDSGDAAGGCISGRYYCGGNGVTGDPAVLYQCTGGTSGTAALTCSKACTRRTGGDDSCTCTSTGHYCGNDNVLGNPKYLYTCNVGGAQAPTLYMQCANGCVVNIGVDDACQ